MPSSPGYIRNYPQEAAAEDPKRRKQRLMRIRARRAVAKTRRIPAGYDVDHVKPLSKGGSNKRSNLRLQRSSSNRSYRRRKDGSMKSLHD